MRLASEEELAETPATWEYLREHEQRLRDREGGRMDHAGWWAFGRHQSLGAHDTAKLGVAATVRHLEVAADPEGGVYFHNVRVNGILLDRDSPSLWTLLVLLNSRLLDFYFRRLAVPLANNHFQANRQFIAPLPIRVPDTGQAAALDALGKTLHAAQHDQSLERRGFLSWLGGEIGTDPSALPGSRIVVSYDQHTLNELLATLTASANRLRVDPSSRAFRELLERELTDSVDRLAPMAQTFSEKAADAEALVYELYEMPARLRGVVDAEYGQA
jgi:hypothetical protein